MLSALKHALNVLGHNLAHALNLALRRPQRISLPRLRRTLLDHQPLQRAIEARTPVGRQVGEVGRLCVELGQELLLEVRQEAEGDALPEVALRDDEEGESACAGLRAGVVGRRLGDDMDEEFGLVDCLMRRGGVG